MNNNKVKKQRLNGGVDMANYKDYVTFDSSVTNLPPEEHGKIEQSLGEIVSTPEGEELLKNAASKTPNGKVILRHDKNGDTETNYEEGSVTIGKQSYGGEYWSPKNGKIDEGSYPDDPSVDETRTASFKPLSLQRALVHELKHTEKEHHPNDGRLEFASEAETIDETNDYMAKYYGEPPRDIYGHGKARIAEGAETRDWDYGQEVEPEQTPLLYSENFKPEGYSDAPSAPSQDSNENGLDEISSGVDPSVLAMVDGGENQVPSTENPSVSQTFNAVAPAVAGGFENSAAQPAVAVIPTDQTVRDNADIQMAEARPELFKTAYKIEAGDPVTPEEQGDVAEFVHGVHANTHGIPENPQVVAAVRRDVETAGGDISFNQLVDHTIHQSNADGIQSSAEVAENSQIVQAKVDAVNNAPGQNQSGPQQAVGELAMAGASPDTMKMG